MSSRCGSPMGSRMTSRAEDRQQKALELRLAGASYDAIARALDYAGKSSAYKAVQTALANASEPSRDVNESDSTELARLDAMLTGLWPKARKGDATAIGLVLRIGERRDVLLSRGVARGTTGEQPTPPKGSVVSEFEAKLAERRTGAAHPRSTGS